MKVTPSMTAVCVLQTLKEESLAWFLAESGYHTWLLDLRGRSTSPSAG